MRKLIILIALFAMVLGMACTHRPGGIAPSTTPLEGRKYVIVGKAQGTDSRWTLLFIIPVSGSNYLDTAVHDALLDTHADALIDVTVDYGAHNYILLQRYYTTVRGKAIRFAQEGDQGL